MWLAILLDIRCGSIDPWFFWSFSKSSKILKVVQPFRWVSTLPTPNGDFWDLTFKTRNGISLQVQGVSRAKLFHESKEEVRESDIFWVGMGMGNRSFFASFFSFDVEVTFWFLKWKPFFFECKWIYDLFAFQVSNWVHFGNFETKHLTCTSPVEPVETGIFSDKNVSFHG